MQIIRAKVKAVATKRRWECPAGEAFIYYIGHRNLVIYSNSTKKEA